MSDIETRLREALNAAVAEAQPPPAVMELVRRRYRRRNSFLAAAAAAAVVVIAAAIPLVSALQSSHERARPGHRHGRLVFPGGGRMLLLNHGNLEWLYPDGREMRIASGLAGAASYGSKLLAWKDANPPGASVFLPRGCFSSDCTRLHELSYYTMKPDGSDYRLVLPAQAPDGNAAVQYEDAQLSPDGSRLAYVSQELRNGSRYIFLGASELWSTDLATGRTTDLGPATSPFAWNSNATLLLDSRDGRSIQLLDARNGRRTAYLTIGDPRLITAYERARPGRGRPTSVSLDGWSPGSGSSVLAVTVDGGRTGAQPAIILVEKGRVLALTPGHSKWIILNVRLSASGIVLLTSQSGWCDCPDLWSSFTYAGAIRGRQLSPLTGIPVELNASAVNPEGTVIALDDFGIIDLLPVPTRLCGQAGACQRFPMKQLVGRGDLVAWRP